MPSHEWNTEFPRLLSHDVDGITGIENNLAPLQRRDKVNPGKMTNCLFQNSSSHHPLRFMRSAMPQCQATQPPSDIGKEEESQRKWSESPIDQKTASDNGQASTHTSTHKKSWETAEKNWRESRSIAATTKGKMILADHGTHLTDDRR